MAMTDAEGRVAEQAHFIKKPPEFHARDEDFRKQE
jgi:hypothetical protein